MRYDADTRVFELSYEGRSDLAPHVIYVPVTYPAAFSVTCDGAAITPTPARDAATGRVEVVCAGPGARVVRLTPDEG